MQSMDITNLKEEKFLAEGATSRIYIALAEGREVIVKRAKTPQWSPHFCSNF